MCESMREANVSTPKAKKAPKAIYPHCQMYALSINEGSSACSANSMRILYTAMIGTNCMMAVITASNIAPMSSRRLVPAISINRASPVLRLFVSIALLFIRLLELPSFYPLLFLPKIAIQSFLCQKSLMLALLHTRPWSITTILLAPITVPKR